MKDSHDAQLYVAVHIRDVPEVHRHPPKFRIYAITIAKVG